LAEQSNKVPGKERMRRLIFSHKKKKNEKKKKEEISQMQ
jgi:hypothetical protein